MKVIDKNSPIPRFLQMADIIKHDFIQNKSYTADNLPSVDDLSEKYKLSKATVNHAIKSLKEKEELTPNR